MLLIAAIAALTVSAASSPAPAPQPSPTPCSSVNGFHALDFWIGTWRVTSGGQYGGADTVESILYGCAVVENWSDADGSHGMSLFYYNAFEQTWAQVWVTDRATARGGS